MCVTPCFEIFHTEIHYRKCALQYHICNDILASVKLLNVQKESMLQK